MAVTSTTLGQACTLKAGKFIAANDITDEYRDGLYPCYGGNGIRGYVPEHSHEGTYPLIGRQGALCGNVNFASGKFRATEHAVVVQPNVQMNIRWLYYKLLSMNLGQYATGAAQPGLAVAKLEQLPFAMPSLEEQERLSILCDHVEFLISIRKQQLAKLDELVKARFVEMFGDCTNIVLLSEVAEVTGGLTKNSKRDSLPLHMPYLRVANVSFATIDVTEMLEIGLTEDEYDKTRLCDGDLLFVEGNGSPDQIGRVAVWHNEISPCVHQNHLIKARFHHKEVLPVYAMHYFMSQQGRMQIKKEAVSTSGLYTLSVTKIESLELPKPALKLQHQFAAFVAQNDKQKLTIQQSLDKLELMKKALIQKYFG